MSRYIFSATAKQDLRAIRDYIADYSIAGADRFLDTVRDRCRLLAKFPAMGRSREELAPSLRS